MKMKMPSFFWQVRLVLGLENSISLKIMIIPGVDPLFMFLCHREQNTTKGRLQRHMYKDRSLPSLVFSHKISL
jgi:hypothetical protein